MSYTANLTSSQILAIANSGDRTNITLISSTPGQQQSQSSSFTTGVWQTPPQLYKTEAGFVLKLNSNGKDTYVLIQANGMSSVAAPGLNNAIEIELQETDDAATVSSNMGFEPMQPMKPMQPMQSMQPMKMGNMSMDINSMSMKMGNMSLNMNDNQTSSSTKIFCSQCGQEAKPNARFCSSCGHQLDK